MKTKVDINPRNDHDREATIKALRQSAFEALEELGRPLPSQNAQALLGVGIVLSLLTISLQLEMIEEKMTQRPKPGLYKA